MLVLVVLISVFGSVRCDFECLCSYNVEKPVFSTPNRNGQKIGYMYEFDCKPTLKKINVTDKVWTPIAFEHKVGFIESDQQIEVVTCPGSPSVSDTVTTSTSTTASSTTTPTLSYPQTSRTSKSSSTQAPTTGSLLGQTSTSTTSTTSPASISRPIVTSATRMTQSSAQTNTTTTTPNSTLASVSPSSPTIQATNTATKTLRSSTRTIPNTRTGTTASATRNTSPSTIGNTTLSITKSTAPSTTIKTTPSMTTSTTPSTTTSTTPSTTTSTPPSTTTSTTPSMTTSTTPSTTIKTTPSTTTSITPSTTTSTTTSTTPSTTSSTTTTTSMSTSPATTAAPHCPYHWTMHSGSCYLFHTEDRRSWTEAEDLCLRHNSHLAFIESKPENDFIVGQLKGSIHGDDLRHDKRSGTWIGGSDEGIEKLWCGMALTNQSHSVCLACPPGWRNFSSSCYLFHTSSRNDWFEATHHCAVHNAHIVFIETAAEDKFLVSQLRTMIDTSHHSDSKTAVWIGGTDELWESHWVWYGDDVPISGYSNWYPGEPDTGDGEKDEDCICLVGDKRFQWQDYECSRDMFYVCERPNSVGSAVVG